jgi:hypothetical protein
VGAHSTIKPKKFKQALSVRLLMATVFWDRKGVLMVEFMQHGTTLMSEVCCETENIAQGLPFRTEVAEC